MKTKKSKAKQISMAFLIDLIVPLLLFVLSVVLIFTVFIPVQKQISEIKAQKKKEELVVKRLQTKYKTVTAKSPSELKEILDKLTIVVPDYINIGELGKVINQMNADYGLTVDRLYLQQEQLVVDSKSIESLNTSVTVKVIRGPFRLSGPKDKIFEFLDSLVTGPYATEFDAVTVSGVGNDNWNVAFSVILYYLPKKQNIPPEKALVVPNWDVINETIKYIDTHPTVSVQTSESE